MTSKVTAPFGFDFSTRNGCLKALEKSAEAVVAGSLDPKRASCVGYLVYRAMLAHRSKPRPPKKSSTELEPQYEPGSYEAMIASLGPED